MPATLLQRIKKADAGGVVEIVVWRVPERITPCTHSFKYGLAYSRDGRRIVGYDNERGKGDHKHVEGRELPYQFIDVSTLLDDFWREVDAIGG